jgi:hypothetical protein
MRAAVHHGVRAMVACMGGALGVFVMLDPVARVGVVRVRGVVTGL